MSLHEMNVLDRTGHLTVNWDVDNDDEVKAAREMFDTMRAKGYSAFTVKGKKHAKPGEKLTTFDADVEEMILTPPIAGDEMPIPMYDNGTAATTLSTNYITFTVTTATTTATTLQWVNAVTYSTPTRWINTGVNTFDDDHIFNDDPARNFAMNMESQRQMRQVKRHMRDAKQRARDLLLARLTDEQRRTFIENKWFMVEGGASKKRYRIRDKGDLIANIDVLADASDEIAHHLCGHARIQDIPLEDQLLTQKLMLEFDEQEFLRIANVHQRGRIGALAA